MANERIVTDVVVNADFSNLISDINKATSSLAKLQEQLNTSNKTLAVQAARISQTFSETLRSTGQFSTHFVSLSSDVQRFGKDLDGGKLKLKDYFRTFQDHTKTSGGLIRELAKQQVALQNAILQPLGRNAQGLMQFNVQVPRGLDEIKNKSAIARQELQILNKVVQDGGVQLINWGKNTQWAGRQLTVGLTVPLAAFGKAAADAFRQADQELTRLTKVYGGLAQTSTEELGQVRKQVSQTAKELASTYGVSFNETISLAADIAATGKQGNELLGSIKETSRLAVLGEVDRQEAMKATLAIQSAFKQNTEQLSESINFLNAVENQTSTTLQDLVEAIPKAGPVVEGLGGSVKDLALYLTAMREGGINAAEGANALKSSLASLINPTKVATEMFAGFGIDLKGIVEKNAGNLTGTILELQAALDTLDPLSKQRAIEQLFGKFQFSRLNALFENLGRQGSQTVQVLDLMKASSQDLANVAGRELAQVTESAAGKYKRALESLKADLAGVGEQFLKVQTFFINLIDKVVNFVNKLPDPIQKILTFLGGITAVAGPLIMLTGVLANFFGYVIKGVAHMKAFFRGAEGWKLLTPEILAAEKAGNLMEETFYSDAKAADVLKLALRNLNTELDILTAKAASGAVSASPIISTVAGNVIGGGLREVNPQHPLVGAIDTRSMSHMRPVAGMTQAEKEAQTLFGVVPGAPKVNNKIKDNPQMYMSGDLPKIPGLTSISGVSTGVVAEEAAKWHAMTGALAMQSQEEIKKLKAEVSATGLITTGVSQSYEALLPEMQRITSLAAAKSAEIVAELQAGKVTMDQARAKIIALNQQIESMMAASATQVATSLGRTIDVNKVPLVNQPIVDATTGKSNLKEITKPGRTRDLLNKIATNLGVRTYGSGYSTETTRPKRFATGVVGLASGFRNTVTKIGGLRSLKRFKVRGEGPERTGRSNRSYSQEGAFPYEPISRRPTTKPSSRNAGWRNDELLAMGAPEEGWVVGHLYTSAFNKTVGGKRGKGASPRMLGSEIESRFGAANRPLKDVEHDILPSNYMTISEDFNKALSPMSGVPYATGSMFMNMGARPEHLLSLTKFLTEQGYSKEQALVVARRALNRIEKAMTNIGDKVITETQFGNIATAATLKELESLDRVGGAFTPYLRTAKRLKDGVTQLPGYGGGDSIPALLEPGESVVTKTATAGNRGALSLMNAGYPLDQILGLEYGDVDIQPTLPGMENAGKSKPQTFWQQARTNATKNYYGKSLVSRGVTGGLSSPFAGMGIGMGMQAAGSMMGGQMGMLLQVASILPMISMKPITGLINGLSKITGAIRTGSGALQVFKTLMLNAFRAVPIIAAATAVYGLIKAFQIFQREKAQNEKEQTMLHGVTEKAATQAGIRYNKMSSSISDVTKQLKLARESGQLAYENLNTTGISGLTMTIAELKQATKDAKKNMSEYVDTVNNLDGSAEQNKQTIKELAANWKAQFLAAGMSVEDATNKIYAIINASDKANLAFAAISSQGFRDIIDKGTAATSLIKDLGKNLNSIGKGEDLDNALGNVMNALDQQLAVLMKQKNANGDLISQQDAMKQLWDQINSTQGSSTKISQEQLDKLKDINPELGKILSTSDSIATMYGKWRLLLAGVTVDLNKLNESQIRSLLLFEDAMSTTIDKAEESNKGLVGKSQTIINKLRAAVASGGEAASRRNQKTQDQIKEEIKLIDKKIKKINEEADARKRALQEQQDAQSYEIQLQQAQLEYQAAVASGDENAIAQARLKMAALVKERETQKTLDAIEEKRRQEEEALLARKERLQEQADKANQNLVTAQQGAATSTERLNKVQGFQTQYEDLLKRQARLNEMKPSKERDDLQREIIGALQELATNIGKEINGKDKALSEMLKSAFASIVDSAGKSLIGAVQTAYNGRGMESSFVGGKGFESFKADAASLAKQAKDIVSGIGGGASLKDISNALGGKGAPGTKDNPFTVKSGTQISRFGANKDVGASGSSWQGYGINSDREAVKDYANQQGYKPGQYFETTFNGKRNLFYVEKDGNITRVKANYASGGSVVGPGSGTSDSIPAMLSNGEYVVRAASVSAIGVETLDKINRMAAGGYVGPRYDVPRFSTGGRVNLGTGTPGGIGGNTYNIENKITIEGAKDMDYNQLAKAIAYEEMKALSMSGLPRSR